MPDQAGVAYIIKNIFYILFANIVIYDDISFSGAYSQLDFYMCIPKLTINVVISLKRY